MIATSFDESNLVMDTPPGVDPEEIYPLSVFRGQDVNGNRVVISCWKPTAEEMEEIKRTGRVWVIMHCIQMQPIAVEGKSPFREFGG